MPRNTITVHFHGLKAARHKENVMSAILKLINKILNTKFVSPYQILLARL
jgi:hypothetical protein